MGKQLQLFDREKERKSVVMTAALWWELSCFSTVLSFGSISFCTVSHLYQQLSVVRNILCLKSVDYIEKSISCLALFYAVWYVYSWTFIEHFHILDNDTYLSALQMDNQGSVA